jgi:hypothetical protein
MTFFVPFQIIFSVVEECENVFCLAHQKCKKRFMNWKNEKPFDMTHKTKKQKCSFISLLRVIFCYSQNLFIFPLLPTCECFSFGWIFFYYLEAFVNIKEKLSNNISKLPLLLIFTFENIYFFSHKFLPFSYSCWDFQQMISTLRDFKWSINWL